MGIYNKRTVSIPKHITLGMCSLHFNAKINTSDEA